MEAITSRKEPRPWVVDLLSTLFVAFCIGVAAAIVLGACVMLMAGEARGAEPAGAASRAASKSESILSPAEETRAKVIELALTHHLVTKYASLLAIDRPADRSPAPSRKASALARTPASTGQP
ncbi:MAG TPA: hypothetical protein VIW78_11450 [Burkholderiales bacterium]